MNRQTLNALLAERLLGCKRGPCRNPAGDEKICGGICGWCGRKFERGDASPCSKYPFRPVLIEEIMEALGKKGYRVTLFYNPRDGHGMWLCAMRLRRGDGPEWAGSGGTPWPLMAKAAQELGLLGEAVEMPDEVKKLQAMVAELLSAIEPFATAPLFYLDAEDVYDRSLSAAFEGLAVLDFLRADVAYRSAKYDLEKARCKSKT